MGKCGAETMKKLYLIFAVAIILSLLMSGLAFAEKGKPEPTPTVVPIGKQVKDQNVKDYLKKQGIDEKKVMLEESFTKEHPNSERYRNLETGDVIEAFTGLPRINKAGEWINAVWIDYIYSDADWDATPNTFTAKVYGTEVQVAQDGERLWWNPELYISGARVYPVSNKASLADDIWNENYKGNCLTWDYGVAIRYVRIIEGGIYERWLFKQNPDGEVLVKHRQGGRIKLELGLLLDANYQAIPIVVEQEDWERVSIKILDKAIYPITLAATATVYPSPRCDAWAAGGIWGGSYSPGYDPFGGLEWSELRALTSAAYGSSYSTSGTLVGWRINDSLPALHMTEYIIRSFFMFDTSVIPDTATVTAATFSVRGLSKAAQLGDTPNINVYQATNAYTDVYINDDWDTITTTAYCAAPITYAGWSETGYNSFTFNAAGIAAVNVAGTTKLGLRNANYDVANVPPNYPPSDLSDWATNLKGYFVDQGAGYEPKLVITYTPTLPDITTQAATDISNHAARLNSVVVTDGGDPAEVRFGYGTTSKTVANFNLYDTVTSWVAGYETGEHPYFDATGLINNTLYYFRVQIRNATGNDTGDELTFTTTNNLEEPSDLRGYPLATEINLDWTKGAGSDYTLVRYSYETYPGNISQGFLAYYGKSPSCAISGLTSGTTVYISAWGQSGGNYSAAYATLLMTTSFDDSTAATTTSPPSMPYGWFLTTDYTKLSKMPFYGGLNTVADGINMPRATFWIFFVLGCIMIISVPVVFVVGASAALLVAFMLMVLFTLIGILPMILAFSILVFAIGIGGLKWRLEA